MTNLAFTFDSSPYLAQARARSRERSEAMRHEQLETRRRAEQLRRQIGNAIIATLEATQLKKDNEGDR